MSVDISIAFRGRARVGEGPVWDERSGYLHWVDIVAGRVYTGDPLTGGQNVITLPTLVGSVALKESAGFVAATADGFAAVRPDGEITARLDVLPEGQRMNDGKCDPLGHFWAGSTEMGFAPGQGALHVLSPDWKTRQVLDGLILPNGLAWSLDGQTMYLIDTMAGELNAFDVRPDSELMNRRLLCAFPSEHGIPDGMTIDAQGCLWIAMWGGSRIVRVSPEGGILLEVPMPVAQPSSCTFGGANLDVLYVTSARDGLDVDDDDVAGSVFALRGHGTHGLPAVRFRG